jgi:competence protein ComEC
MLLILIVFAQGIYKVPLRDCDMVFLDVGQGDCLFMETSGGYTVMIDSGEAKTTTLGERFLLPYLLKNGHRKNRFGSSDSSSPRPLWRVSNLEIRKFPFSS